MKSKILIAANMSILALVLTGCPSTPVMDKAAKEQTKQQMIKRSDQQFKDMEQQMNNNN